MAGTWFYRDFNCFGFFNLWPEDSDLFNTYKTFPKCLTFQKTGPCLFHRDLGSSIHEAQSLLPGIEYWVKTNMVPAVRIVVETPINRRITQISLHTWGTQSKGKVLGAVRTYNVGPDQVKTDKGCFLKKVMMSFRPERNQGYLEEGQLGREESLC